MKKVGRPIKYDRFLKILEDDVVYSPATIVRAGEQAGLFQPGQGVFDGEVSHAEIKRAKLRIRHSLARLQKHHFFPQIGDGVIALKGQPIYQGWHGKRWKSILSA